VGQLLRARLGKLHAKTSTTEISYKYISKGAGSLKADKRTETI
jgi:hypothetical protein